MTSTAAAGAVDGEVRRELAAARAAAADAAVALALLCSDGDCNARRLLESVATARRVLGRLHEAAFAASVLRVR